MARCRPEDCNLETDNLTIIWYHNYSGGKFMANCLSLSDHGLFGHKEITEAQLRGEFSPDDKLKYLLGELSEIEKGMTWTDLHITDNFFFGFDKKDYIDPWRGISYHDYVKDVSHGDYKFFIASHFNPEVIEIKKIWKNANIILFTHPHDYVEKRASKDPNIKVFYERLCDYEENIEEMRALPNHIFGYLFILNSDLLSPSDLVILSPIYSIIFFPLGIYSVAKTPEPCTFDFLTNHIFV